MLQRSLSATGRNNQLYQLGGGGGRVFTCSIHEGLVEQSAEFGLFHRDVGCAIRKSQVCKCADLSYKNHRCASVQT